MSPLSPEKADRLIRNARPGPFDLEAELQAVERAGARLLFRGDPEYPALLGKLSGAPDVLYVLGTLAPAAPLAIVGSRRPTAYGLRMARVLARGAVGAGLAVVSGLARGIDSAAHEGALEAGGATWAVLGSGLDRVYPPENAPLARRIVDAGGCLLSEFPMNSSPETWHFPRRNRIVSGISWATVVVEGEARSGSLGTALHAVEQGRGIFAVPGPADSPLSAAPHQLLREGAVLATSINDVLQELPAACGVRPGPAGTVAPRRLDGERGKILESLGSDSQTVESLSRGTGLDLPRLSRILFAMEMEGLISPLPGQRYGRR